MINIYWIDDSTLASLEDATPTAKNLEQDDDNEILQAHSCYAIKILELQSRSCTEQSNWPF